MHYHHDRFMQAISEKRKVVLTHFTSSQEECDVTRLCVPVDYRSVRHSDYFYVWDPQANIGERLLGLPIWQVKSIELSEETFDPSEYITP